MRSKEVEEAIKRIGQLYNGISVGLIINVKSDGTTCKSLETVLSYIETLEQLPNKIRDRIKAIESETWYIDSSEEAKQSCIEELESLLGGE